MTINHRDEAERLLRSADTAIAAALEKDLPIEDQQHAAVLTGILTNRALGHATLARDEEQAATSVDLRDANQLLRRRDYAMREAISAHIAAALTSKNPERWKAGRDLARDLDKADANIDKAIDSFVCDAGYDPKTAWNGPGEAQSFSDPWAATPDITAEIPGPVRRVLSDYLAAALLSKGDAQGVGQTITFALKAAGADLTGDIEKRITELTLGPDPSDPPF
ncbi:hypothetical protein OIU91_06315 [Streptomyces sp. NBC_01456]|uniref:hypothetical protein n=1 Tax=Streptomyces sp. NBC_01456 TaxID=2975868 RepID=UPI002E380E56|nr:hypothetical protein [Streptomyces sp. NBC_01456]